MALKDDTRLESFLKLATEAKKLRDKAKEFLKAAQSMEEQAKQVRKEMLKDLQNEKEKLKEEYDAINVEYCDLASTFCNQKEKHTFTYRSEQTSSIPLESTYWGCEYPTVTYKTCLVCGWTDDPIDYYHKLRHRKYGTYQKGSERVIQEASRQKENLELQKTAQRILEIPKQRAIIYSKWHKKIRDFEKISSLSFEDPIF